MKATRNLIRLSAALAALIAAVSLQAAQDGGSQGLSYKRYIVELKDMPLALYDGRELSAETPDGLSRLTATMPQLANRKRLDARSAESVAYLRFLESRHNAFRREIRNLLGRTPKETHRYRNALNGMALHLTPSEAALIAQSPMVSAVSEEQVFRLETYAGPQWLGAETLWNGDAGLPAAQGEGVIVANIDTGINLDHPSFSDSNYAYTNPYGSYLGYCSDPEVQCNNKVVGVYDFVEDNPDTEDWVEENTKGIDNNGHGSHTAGIAAGAPTDVTVNRSIQTTISGVAPRATIVSYRVCYMGEPYSQESEGCLNSAIAAAIDQAIADGVDVINYSIGGDARDPWINGTADRAFLAARAAGIFVVSSAGNTGPNEATVSSPAIAPWIMAVGNATHNYILATRVENFSGGDTPVPEGIIGASLTDGLATRPIVHAKDYGYPLCGVGDPELQPSCDANTGASNPWDGQQPFNGEIVVCDRGLYGRVEKGKNLLLAGAGGFILANTEDQGESIVSDNHCLPASHIGVKDGDALRSWLDSGSGHEGRISNLVLAQFDDAADQLSFSSSRGPAPVPVQDILKPNVIAPGTGILAAGYQGDGFLILSGTSMASPHVAGAAALLKSVHPDWTVSQIASAIETTATQELAKDENGDTATTQQAGAGRPQLDEAASAGLYLNVTSADFVSANPNFGGDPGALNLPGLVESKCQASCGFTRTVTDMMGGGDWTATPEGFPDGVDVTISPASFSLGNSASQQLGINVDVSGSGIVGDWISGRVRLSAPGSSDLYLTVSVNSYGGDLPDLWPISTDSDGASMVFGLNGLVGLPDATFTAGGPVRVERATERHVEDPSIDDPYDGGQGVFTRWHNLPDGALWLYAETLASTAEDLDLFVGRDEDGDGQADEWEELCSSTTPIDLERCDLYDLPAGNYWILVQNWSGTNAQGDEMTLLHAAVEPDGGLAASGPGITRQNESFPVRVSWDNFGATPGETWLGAVGIGAGSDRPNGVGVIPVEITRSGVAAASTFPLMNGETHGLALAGNGRHDRIFIDVPPGASSLTVSAQGATAEQSNALSLELVRMDFDAVLVNPPFTVPASGSPAGSASGAGGLGPIIQLTGGVSPGRWYAVVENGSASPLSVAITAEVQFQGEPLDTHRGLWFPASRPTVGQGYDYNWGGSDRALIWYTYDEDGLPTWYIAGAPSNDGNIWTTDILRVTNDGTDQKLAPVGSLSVTQLSREDAMFSYTLHGESGSERMTPLSGYGCPQVGGNPASYTGIWFKGVAGLGGASVLVNDITQTQIHYLFDDDGRPRWLFAQDPENNDPLDTEIPILQFHGYCAVCEPADVGYVNVGTLERGFDNDTNGFWTLDYRFDQPPSGTVNRTDQVIKLTQTLECQ